MPFSFLMSSKLMDDFAYSFQSSFHWHWKGLAFVIEKKKKLFFPANYFELEHVAHEHTKKTHTHTLIERSIQDTLVKLRCKWYVPRLQLGINFNTFVTTTKL